MKESHCFAAWMLSGRGKNRKTQAPLSDSGANPKSRCQGPGEEVPGDAAQEYKVSVGMREPWSCTAGPVVAESVAVTGSRLTVLIGASPPWLLEIH